MARTGGTIPKWCCFRQMNYNEFIQKKGFASISMPLVRGLRFVDPMDCADLAVRFKSFPFISGGSNVAISDLS